MKLNCFRFFLWLLSLTALVINIPYLSLEPFIIFLWYFFLFFFSCHFTAIEEQPLKSTNTTKILNFVQPMQLHGVSVICTHTFSTTYSPYPITALYSLPFLESIPYNSTTYNPVCDISQSPANSPFLIIALWSPSFQITPLQGVEYSQK